MPSDDGLAQLPRRAMDDMRGVYVIPARPKPRRRGLEGHVIELPVVRVSASGHDGRQVVGNVRLTSRDWRTP